MRSSDIREGFLEYFRENGHTVVRSASLVPQNDPTLLFVNAGMVQFKNVFLGVEQREYSRATSCQKCVRAGGKHNDLENVGYTARHHTFFEMLGNFSFGDYFKKEAIHFGWEFITRVIGLKPEVLWVTVFREDDEAFEIWNKQEGVPSSRIVRMDEKDNFWAMGDTGPCGPCSEIHIDQGPNVGCGRSECSVACDCDRFLELWNLVFMELERREDGNLVPLPKKNIDTGLGLERLAAITQGVLSNFDTDLFRGIMDNICDYFSYAYGSDSDMDVAVRVIADHLRALDFIIADGVLPDKEGRGYVLRRIIRRAMRFGKKLGAKEPFLCVLVKSVNESLGGVYPEIVSNAELVKKVLRQEEEQFLSTIDAGLKVLEGMFARSLGGMISGEDAFKLYDTYGFPLDLTESIAREKGFSVDIDGFNRCMEKRRQASRATWTGTGDESIDDMVGELFKTAGVTSFVGYESHTAKGRLKAIAHSGGMKANAGKGDYFFVFDVTPFYGETGGQVADTGFIMGEKCRAYVSDVKRYFDGKLFLHKVEVLEGEFNVGREYELRINKARRKDIARHHSATHLLDAALIRVLGSHVRQAGSLVEEDRLRFDFTHFSKLTENELSEVEETVNLWVLENYPVVTRVMSLDEAMKSGAIAVFDERYSDVVRVVSMGDVSMELCGGTHVRHTGEIGLFKIVSESAVARGVRRIEARVGMSAYEYIVNIERTMRAVVNKLSVGMEDVVGKIEELKKKPKGSMFDFDESRIRIINDCRFYVDRIDGVRMAELRNFSDVAKSKMKGGVVLLFSVDRGKVHVICNVSVECSDKFPANKVVSSVSKLLGGKGGGKKTFAQGGGRYSEVLDRIVNGVENFI